MSEITFEGMDDLIAAIKTNASMKAVKQVVKQNTLELEGKTVKNAGEKTFNKGYFTGNLKQGVGYKLSDAGMTGSVGATADYGPYLEVGTRFMAAEPFLKEPFKVQGKKFKADLDKLAK